MEKERVEKERATRAVKMDVSVRVKERVRVKAAVRARVKAVVREVEKARAQIQWFLLQMQVQIPVLSN